MHAGGLDLDPTFWHLGYTFCFNLIIVKDFNVNEIII